jgi:FG-GAP-like repeat
MATSFAQPQFVLSAFGSVAGGWSSQNLYPRLLADVNHDSNADIVGFASNGVLVSLANGSGGFQGPVLLGGTSFWGAQTGGWSSQDTYPRLLADLDHNSDADIVGFATNGVYVSHANGTGGFLAPGFASGTSFWGAQTGGWSSQDTYPREVVDVNGDGNADIVGFASNGVYVSLMSFGVGFQDPNFVAGTSFWGAQTGGWSSQDTYPRFIADVTGDGFADIVGFAQNGVYVAGNTHSGVTAPIFVAGSSFWGTQTGGWSSQNLYPRELADVNGDGMADLVGFAQSGVYVSLATGGALSGTFAAPALVPNSSFWGAGTGGWSSQDAYPRELANITNGDTKADIVGFAQNGVWTSISTSTIFFTSTGSDTASLSSSSDVALLSQYMAGSFATSSDGNGGTLTDTALTTQQDWLTLPHA